MAIWEVLLAAGVWPVGALLLAWAQDRGVIR